jgi:DNA (cytosine-5)-methyltransferase 1
LFTLDNEFRIRKLTPRECFRLQDFPDDFKFVVSNSQLYKQSGNSISVNVMEMIFKQIEASRYRNTNGGLF